MKEHLIIKNFGPITDMDVEIKAFTVFIGPQGSGKSTAAKVLTICRDVSWYIQIIDHDDDVREPFRKFCIDEYFHDNTYLNYKNGKNGFAVIYQNGKFEFDTQGVPIQQAKDILLKILYKAKKSLLERIGITDTNIKVDDKIKPLVRANSRMMLYIPAERNLAGVMSKSLANMILAKIPIYDALIEYMSVFEKAKYGFTDYHVPFLGVTFSMNDGQEKVWIGKGDKKRNPLPLQSCSSGLQSVLPLLMSIDYSFKANCFNTFAIEEPEQNLYPSNQRELIYRLVEICNNTKTKGMLLTTHSPYILSCMNVVVLAGIIRKNEETSNEVDQIVGDRHYLKASDVAVYRLNPAEKQFCENLINPDTGLIGVNALDMVSEYIGEDYDRLYRLYIKQLRKK